MWNIEDVPYKYKKVIDNLSKSKNLVILKQDKRGGFVILDKYTKKFMTLLNADRFKKLLQILLQPQKEKDKKFWEK